MPMGEQIQQKTADTLAGATGITYAFSMASVEHFLNTAVLCLGMVSGSFSIYFHVRRYLKERKEKRDVEIAKSIAGDSSEPEE